MSTRIAEYFTDELEAWHKNINSYRQEMFEMGNRLAEVIHRNTIPNIAELVEQHQEKLNKIAIKFFQLLDQLKKQEASLKTDRNFIDDTMINAEIEKYQNALHRFMQRSEKEYIDIKHGCSNFLSDTFRKQRR